MKIRNKIGFLIFFSVFFMGGKIIVAQENQEAEYSNVLIIDTLQQPIRSPLIATISSALIPGLGQIYNESYWKVPLIYASLSAVIFSVTYHNNRYLRYKEALANYNSPGPYQFYDPTLLEEELRYYKDQHRRLRDLSYIGLFGIYILNILDASVDAHLYDYDISNDLSLKWQPIMFPICSAQPTNTLGVSIFLNF